MLEEGLGSPADGAGEIKLDGWLVETLDSPMRRSGDIMLVGRLTDDDLCLPSHFVSFIKTEVRNR